MILKHMLKTWDGVMAENRWSRVIIVSLVLVVMFLTFMLSSKKTIVTIQPFTLTTEAWVTPDGASKTYHEAWGMAVAQLLGNVTPSNSSFIKDLLGPLLAPAIYQEVMDSIETQSQQIRNDRVSLRFEPRMMEYEEATGKTFVNGYSSLIGVNNNIVRNERTYEFTIRISNYLPVFEHLDTYQGRPRTQRVLQQQSHKRSEGK